jgi:hypothetical protein
MISNILIYVHFSFFSVSLLVIINKTKINLFTEMILDFWIKFFIYIYNLYHEKKMNLDKSVCSSFFRKKNYDPLRSTYQIKFLIAL